MHAGRGRDHLQRPRQHGGRADARGRGSCSPIRRKMQFVFQDPVRLAQSAHDGVRHRQRAARHPRHRRRGRALRSAVKEMMELVGLDVRYLQALSAQLLRRPAAAHRHRAGARAAARAADLRRAGLGARRLGPGADAQPAEGPAARSSASPTSSSRTISRWSNYIADRIAVMCAGPPGRAGAARAELFRNPLHPYTKALLAAVPEPDPRPPARFRRADGGQGVRPGGVAEPVPHRRRLAPRAAWTSARGIWCARRRILRKLASSQFLMFLAAAFGAARRTSRRCSWPQVKAGQAAAGREAPAAEAAGGAARRRGHRPASTAAR